VGRLAVRRLGRDVWLSGPIEPRAAWGADASREEDGHV